MRTKVTVGICVKNSEKTVREAIGSIINQNYPHELMEIIVVDGGSKDNTLSIVTNAIPDTDMQVRIYSDEGKGLGYARQVVVDHAHGEYIIWVDGDVVLLEDSVEKHVEFMEKNPQVGVALGKYIYDEGTLISTLQNLRKHVKYHEFSSTGKILDMTTNGAIFRLKAVRQVDGFDQNIRGASEDRDIIARIKAKGWLFSLNEKVKFHHSFKETLRDLWFEQVWFGYGGHYISHKRRDLTTPWSHVPWLAFFVDGLRTAIKGYRLVRRKKSFLMPLLFTFQEIAWWFGFVKGHSDGYGHEINQLQ